VASVHAANLAFCEGLNGLPQVAREVMVATLDHFSAQETAIEFGEGEARAPLQDRLKAVLAALPAPVQFGELATGERIGEAVDFADAQSISDAATAYQAEAEGKGISLNHAEAVAVVTAKNR
jgi:hypothetical protein